MPQYLLPRKLEILATPDIPETQGISIDQAFTLAKTARACITLDGLDVEAFQANLPRKAPDYHSYDDLTELVWRNWFDDPEIKPYSKENPSVARGQSMAIWKETIRHGDPELYGKLKYSYWEPVEKAGARISALRRTLISDPSVHDFYVKLRAAGRLPGLGPAAIKLLQMLLAGTHRDLMEPDWPEKVLEFMGDSNAKA